MLAITQEEQADTWFMVADFNLIATGLEAWLQISGRPMKAKTSHATVPIMAVPFCHHTNHELQSSA
jgi:hypothetical protein